MVEWIMKSEQHLMARVKYLLTDTPIWEEIGIQIIMEQMAKTR